MCPWESNEPLAGYIEALRPDRGYQSHAVAWQLGRNTNQEIDLMEPGYQDWDAVAEPLSRGI